MSKRKEWADIAKGIGIILMVLGHTGGPKFIMDWIYAFHMPLFFILSGWFTNFGKQDKFWDFLSHKFATLIIPFVFYSLSVLSVDYFLLNERIVGGGNFLV